MAELLCRRDVICGVCKEIIGSESRNADYLNWGQGTAMMARAAMDAHIRGQVAPCDGGSTRNVEFGPWEELE